MNTKDHAATGRIAAATAIVLWSAGTVIVAKLDLPGVQTAFWRQTLGSLVFTSVLLSKGLRINWSQVKTVAPSAFSYNLNIAMAFVALQMTSVVNFTTITAMQPILLLVIAARRYKEKLGGLLVGSGITAIIGVVLVIQGATASGGDSQLRGDFLGVATMVLFAIYFVSVKEARSQTDTLTLQTIIMLMGTVILLPLAAIEAGTLLILFPTWSHWGWISLLVLIPGGGHLIMNWAHLHVNLTLTGMLTLGIPVLSTFGAWLFLSQSVTQLQIVGMLIVLISLVAIVRHDAQIQTKYS